VTTFTVWQYDDPDRAVAAERVLHEAARAGRLTLHDSATVSWPTGEDRPTTRHRRRDPAHGAGWGTLWGLLFGALFALPVLGAATGAAVGAASRAMSGFGIRRDELERIRESVTQGTSALFAVTEEGDLDELGDAFLSSPVPGPPAAG